MPSLKSVRGDNRDGAMVGSAKLETAAKKNQCASQATIYRLVASPTSRGAAWPKVVQERGSTASERARGNSAVVKSQSENATGSKRTGPRVVSAITGLQI